MTIALGADHAGFDLKEALRLELEKMGQHAIDLGCTNRDPSDYPDHARRVCRSVVEAGADLGILICGTGIGMSIAANRYSGIRAALCLNCEMAYLARSHNNANVLALGSRYVSLLDARAILQVFLGTRFSNESRHVHRIEKLAGRSHEAD